MKNFISKITASMALALLAFNLQAQKLTLTQTETKHEKGSYPCVEVIMEPSPDQVKDAWEDFMKDNYDVKMKGNGLFTNKDVLRAEQVTISAISNKQMDFFTRIVEEGDQTKLCVFGSFGYDIPISNKEYPNEFEAMEIITKRFLKSYLPDYYNGWIKDTQKVLADLQDERKDMQKELKKNREDIEKLTKRNQELEKMLVKNEADIETTAQKLDDKRETFSEINARLQSFNVEGSDQ